MTYRRFALASLTVVSLATAAIAHSWYDPYCCNDQDCAPIAISAVEVTVDGYLVTLEHGDHPAIVEGYDLHQLVPFDMAKVSQDGGYHACVIGYGSFDQVASEDTFGIRCLYVSHLF